MSSSGLTLTTRLTWAISRHVPFLNARELIMSNDDLTYYRHRAEIETELAAQATQPEVVAVHTQLATAYLERVGSGHDATRLTHV
jgi:hypothetical protein